MIPLLIVLLILLLIFFLMLFPIVFYVSYDNGLKYKIKYLFFNITDFSKFKSKKKTDKSNDKKDDKKSSKKLIEKIIDIFDVIKAIFSKVGTAVNHIVIKKLWFDIKISDEDAAKAAIKYGEVCAIVYPALAGIESNVKKVKKQSGEINCVYNESSNIIKFNLIGYIKPIFLIHSGFGILIKLVKLKMKKGTVNKK